MIGQQIKMEFKKIVTRKHIILWIALIMVFPAIKFIMIKDNYVFYRELDIFLRINSDFVPLLFPIIMVLVYTISFLGEQKNNFILYTRIRISLRDYLLAKIITNAILSFFIAFMIVFIPFIFAIYIEPLFGFVTFYPQDSNPLPVTTFEQLLFLGTLPYGMIYSIWVGLNGMLYATIALLLLMILERPFLALSIPFITYLLVNFVAQTLHFDQFAPLSTIFPFSITQQPMWTIFVPFTLLCITVIALGIYLKKYMYKRYE